MRVAEYTVDCAVALGAPLGFGRATMLLIARTTCTFTVTLYFTRTDDTIIKIKSVVVEI